MTIDLGPLERSAADHLQKDYPAWNVSWDGTRWVAQLDHWGVLYGQTTDELRRRLEQWTADRT